VLVVQVLREFAVEDFFSYKSRKRRNFFFYRRATYKDTYVEAFKFRQGWSVAKIRGTRKLRRRPRKVVCLRKKGTLKRRKQEDQGRWSVSARRGRQKKIPEGEKVAPRRKGSVCPQPRNFFFWYTSTWALRDPSRLNIDSYET